jgi:Alpha/beta hydrolase family
MRGSRASAVLFVHGAHLAGWCWLLVMDQLARLGIESHAIDLPLTGYAGDVESVRAAIQAARSRSVSVHVVCHSYAGLPVAEAGHDAGHLTFVAGRLPLAGESPSDQTPRWQFPDFQACMQPGADGFVRLSSAASRFFFHRTPAALADYATSQLRAMSSSVPSAALADPAWASVPSSYVVCADDRAVRPEAQRERAALVGTSVELDTDHSPFFSGAAALADFIADRHTAMAPA